MSTKVADPENVDPSELLQVVRSGEPAGNLTRMRAISTLPSVDVPERVGVLGDLLANPEVQPRYKQLAVTTLQHIGNSEAVNMLQEVASRMEDSHSLGNIASALGRMGDRNTLEQVDQIAERTEGYPHQQAKFAASLLAYRFNLQGHEISKPAADQLVPPSSNGGTFEIGTKPAPSEEVNTALQTVNSAGLRLAKKNALWLECGRRSFLFLWSGAFTNSLSQLREQKGVVGIVGRKSRFEDAYALSLLVMATPGSGQEIDLTLHKPDGRLMYAGTLKLDEQDSTYEVQAVQQSGIAPLRIRGTVVEGKLQVDEAVSSGSIPEHQRPKSLQ